MTSSPDLIPVVTASLVRLSSYLEVYRLSRISHTLASFVSNVMWPTQTNKQTNKQTNISISAKVSCQPTREHT